MSKIKEIANEAQQEIQRLTAERDRIDADIRRYTNVLKACEITGKAAVAVNRDSDAKVKKAVAAGLTGWALAKAVGKKSKRETEEAAMVSTRLRRSTHGKDGPDLEEPADVMTRSLAIAMLKKGEVRPLELAEKAGMRNEYASALLTKLVSQKIAVKVSRGLYAIRDSKELERRIKESS